MAATASATIPQQVPRTAPSFLTSFLRLVRPANLVTAAADICAAAVVSSALVPQLAWLVAASVCLYAGGVTLNDFFDRQLDVLERPERPIPSGAVPAAAAAVIGFTLLVAGVALASVVSPLSAGIAVLLASTILTYDSWAKRNAAGPFVMGLCRALNLLLGLSAVSAALLHLWPLALLPFVYIVAVTTLSRGEVHGGSRKTSGVALLLVSCVIVTLACLPALFGLSHALALLFFVLFFAVRVGPPFWRSWQEPLASTIRLSVHAGVVSLIVLDACLAAAFGGLIKGAAVLSLSVLSAELARFFAVT